MVSCFAPGQFSSFLWAAEELPTGGGNGGGSSSTTGEAFSVGFGVCGSNTWMGFGDDGDAFLGGLINPDPVFYVAWVIVMTACFVGAYFSLRMAKRLRGRQAAERHVKGDGVNEKEKNGNVEHEDPRSKDQSLGPSSSLSCGVIVALCMLFYPVRCTKCLSRLEYYFGCNMTPFYQISRSLLCYFSLFPPSFPPSLPLCPPRCVSDFISTFLLITFFP